MWKKVDDINAHRQSLGIPEGYDPHEWARTALVTVEGLATDGNDVVLSTCCLAVRIAREHVVAWRYEPPSGDRGPSYEVRLRRGAPALVQRSMVVDDEQQRCPRCGGEAPKIPDPRNEWRRADRGRRGGDEGRDGHRERRDGGGRDQRDCGPSGECEPRERDGHGGDEGREFPPGSYRGGPPPGR